MAAVVDNSSSTDPLVDSKESRTRTFHVEGTNFIDGVQTGLFFLPPREKHFDLFFFRQLFDHLQHQTMKAEVPLPALRNMSMKLMEAMQVPRGFDVNFFGVEKATCSWGDLRNALTTLGHPRIELTPMERIYMVLEDQENSKMAKGWFYFIMVVTVANLLGIVWPEASEQVCEPIPGVDGHRCASDFKTACLLIFSLDYFAKLVLSPFVRREVVFPDQVEYFHSSEWTYQPATKIQRLLTFAKQGSNIIDLVAILPFWIELCAGGILPSTSFLRMIRMARLFRIFKTARYLDMLQVLGMTLWKSVGMVLILFCLVGAIGLICGCLFQQLEQHDVEDSPFRTVPHASYWVFARLISMKDVPGYGGQVSSVAGIVVFAATMALKGVLWIVPIARIKQIFTQEYADIMQVGNMRRNMVAELLEFHNAGDRNKIMTPEGTTCAVMHLRGAAVDPVYVPLPILTHKKCVVDGLKVDVPLPDGTAGAITWKMTWEPSEDFSWKFRRPHLVRQIRKCLGTVGRLAMLWSSPCAGRPAMRQPQRRQCTLRRRSKRTRWIRPCFSRRS
eukprot:TRINITY_DN14544_c0_g1_i2.p1 TRINITY_DN14544_c0_g1~~TRINITY_DN14544_c0_g1_i2.p1  ORF type:complete len:588 (+),score=96.33 TRINITY_DN14544_c0_g1_i2:88-1764(+)